MRTQRRKPRVYKRRPKRANTKPKVSAAVRTYVKRTLHSNVENKKYILFQNLIAIANADAATQPYTLNCMPLTSQGTANYQRIGNQIKPMYGTVEGYVNLRQYNAAQNPFSPVYVKMWLVTNKESSTTPLSVPTFANWFDVATTTLPMQGNISDLISPVNKDQWKLHASKVIYLSSSSTSTLYSPGAVSAFDSKGSYSSYFKFRIPCNKKLLYDDNNAIPKNYNVFLIAQAVSADGSPTGTGPFAEISAVKVQWSFEDA